MNQNTSAIQWYFFHTQNSGKRKRKDDHSCSNKGTGPTVCSSPALGLLPLLRRRLPSTVGGTQTSTPSTIHCNSNDTEVEQFYSLLLTYYAFICHNKAKVDIRNVEDTSLHAYKIKLVKQGNMFLINANNETIIAYTHISTVTKARYKTIKHKFV